MSNNMLDWAPDFTVRRSRRAKKLSMRIVSGSLELVLPVRASVAAAHKFLASNRAWVDKNRHLLYTHDDNLPQSINLQFLQKEYFVSLLPSSGRLHIKESADQLLIFVKGHNNKQVKTLLKAWLSRQAKTTLPIFLHTISERYGLSYNKCLVRSQRTIWGSCSTSGDISLNAKLLFCPMNLVEYVMVHELCHMLQSNHSARFWSCVADCLPNYKDSILSLRALEQTLPKWAD